MTRRLLLENVFEMLGDDALAGPESVADKQPSRNKMMMAACGSLNYHVNEFCR